MAFLLLLFDRFLKPESNMRVKFIQISFKGRMNVIHILFVDTMPVNENICLLNSLATKYTVRLINL